MLALLDNGHGSNTPGKRSPVWKDGSQLLEWEFTRDVARRIKRKLDEIEGIDGVLLVPEVTDIALTERANRANKYVKEHGAKNCVFISVHANAGKGTGWEAFTTKGTTNSDKFATIFYECATEKWGKDWAIRKDSSDGDPDKEENYTVLVKTNCPAVLVEYFFMDTEKDCKYINSEIGREDCADVAVSAIIRWANLKR